MFRKTECPVWHQHSGNVPGISGVDQAITRATFNSAALLPFGLNGAFPQGRIVNTWQAQDNWNMVVGKHTSEGRSELHFPALTKHFLPNLNGAFRFTDWDASSTTLLIVCALLKAPPASTSVSMILSSTRGRLEDRSEPDLESRPDLVVLWPAGKSVPRSDCGSGERSFNRVLADRYSTAIPYLARVVLSQEQLWSERWICLLSAVGRVPHRQRQEDYPWRLRHAV